MLKHKNKLFILNRVINSLSIETIYLNHSHHLVYNFIYSSTSIDINKILFLY